MSNPDRAAASVRHDGGPGGASTAATAPVAPAGTATPETPAVPSTTTGAVDARVAAPVVPHTAVGPGSAPAPGPTAFHGGWAAALTLRMAHWVPAGAPTDTYYSRPVGLTLDGWYALIDEQGLADGATLPPCTPCCRELARMSRPAEPGGQS